MIGRVPSVENFVEKLDKDSFGASRNITLPSGVKVPLDNFSKFKNGFGLDKNRHRGSIVDVFGCKSCRWVNSELCPHSRVNGGDVSHLKSHANGICSQRLILPKLLHDEGVKMTGKQMLQVRGLMDAEFFSKRVQDEALAGKRDLNDVFPWEKLKSDILDRMRKQDEGSKLQVTNVVDDLRKTLSGPIIDVKQEQVMFNEEDLEDVSKESD